MLKTKLIAVLALLLLGTQGLAWEDSESYRRGAWETLVQATKKSESAGLREMDVKISSGGSTHVQYQMSPGSTGLVLILSGTFAKADNPYSNDLGRTLLNAGYSIAQMDSFFSNRFITETHHGAPGNLRREAAIAGEVVQELIRRTGNKISEVSVVGVSYGGAVALQMSLLDKAGKLPFKLAHVVAFSVPVSFRETMQRLDEYEDLPYSYDTIVPIVKSAKPGSRVPSDASAEQLEKVIGRGFRLDLSPAVEMIDRMYASRILPSPSAELGFEALGKANSSRMDREVEAGAVSFRALFHYWIARYWQSRGEVKSEDELLNLGEMSVVLPELGDNVEVAIARNDPLNAPGAAAEIEKIQTSAHISILPSGGHAAFVRTEQGKAIIDRIFAKSVAIMTTKSKN
jgi:pimeloyl-ACP methyl ester carboxylesterase